MTIDITDPKALDRLQGDAFVTEQRLRSQGEIGAADLVAELTQAIRNIRRLSDAVSVVFYVAGRGEFPLDMLRYDSCWPVTDTGALIDRGQRRIKMACAKGIGPTVDRWRSFGWTVEPGWDN